MTTAKKVGMLLLSLWLMLVAARSLFNLTPYYHVSLLSNLLGMAAGLFLLWGVVAGWKGKPPAA